MRHRGVVCNPVLTVPEGQDRKLDDSEEGCLSLPGAFMACARADYASVSGFDERGEPVTYAGMPRVISSSSAWSRMKSSIASARARAVVLGHAALSRRLLWMEHDALRRGAAEIPRESCTGFK